MQFFEVFHLLLSFLPPWFEICVGLTITVMLVVALFRLIAFVMDVLPFI